MSNGDHEDTVEVSAASLEISTPKSTPLSKNLLVTVTVVFVVVVVVVAVLLLGESYSTTSSTNTSANTTTALGTFQQQVIATLTGHVELRSGWMLTERHTKKSRLETIQ
jgi:hypothetical protein